MPAPPLPPVQLPQSYASLDYTSISLSHHPATSKEVTPIIILTLNRPKANNAFTEQMGEEMVQCFRMFDVDDRVKVIVVTGQGKMFCPGADLQVGFRRSVERIGEHRDGGGRVTTSIHACRKPVIAAINGSAVGIGITMTLPMAIRIAPKTAKIGFVFGRRGLIMEAASSFFLPRLIGRSRAMHLVTTGLTYSPAHRLMDGLFSEVVDTPAEVLPRAIELAEDIAVNVSSVSWALMRDLMWRGKGSAEETHLLDSRIIYELFGTADNGEGVKSFMEKRPPKFVGTMYEHAPQTYPWWTPTNIVYPAKGKVNGPKL
ncbi:enoyl-CoA hydratase/isomerase family protein [Microthyrium microscopicum]|uniref:Enoyl-CoA hydratase/isomerase family protein n=1 Tax=Microthyrium microscopicum TaxID=703497 RepID=A0A6A6UCJ1_9PEZI|nr:enoyl-CoA hydratase/isomerase family protein [Microthyrium microscopicum]